MVGSVQEIESILQNFDSDYYSGQAKVARKFLSNYFEDMVLGGTKNIAPERREKENDTQL